MISLLCPTRGRPGNVLRMLKSARETAVDPFEVIFRTDDDDTPPGDEITSQPGVKVLTGPRVTLSSLWTECSEFAAGDIMMQCDDEVLFRTPAWDVIVEAAFARYPDKIIFAHGQDLYQPAGTFGTLGFLHRRWVDTVGYFTPPYFSCDFGDTWLNDVANALDRRVYLSDVITEHLHPVAGKGEWDRTHQERLARGSRDNVAGQYASLAHLREADVARLRRVMQ